MSNSVTIKVPARLHLGFLDLSGDAARRFGSLGLPLSEPETVITLSHARENSAEGPDAARAAVPAGKWGAVPPVTSFLLWSRMRPRISLTPGAGSLRGRSLLP